MIARNHRFHGRGSLRHVYQHGKTVRAPELGLRFMVHDRRQTYRIAIVVSKSISKSAVVRNRIRRRLYEIIRQRASGINGPYDLVVTVYKPTIKEMSEPDLSALLTQLFRRAGIMNLPRKPGTETHAIIEAKEN